MEKYYTPTIDEFHVGFEYEYTLLAGWRSNTFQLDSNIQALEQAINAGYIRVKYLDREDIESVGWKYIKNVIWAEAFKKNGNYLYLSTDTSMVQIDDGEGYPEGTQSFQGTIRNISELKKLMKQLNIQVP